MSKFILVCRKTSKYVKICYDKYGDRMKNKDVILKLNEMEEKIKVLLLKEEVEVLLKSLTK